MAIFLFNIPEKDEGKSFISTQPLRLKDKAKMQRIATTKLKYKNFLFIKL